MADETLGVTFVVPTLNAAPCLERCLASVARQDYHPALVEVLVVDGGSTDETIEIAERLGAVVAYNPEKLAEPGVSLGFQKARREIRVVLAADNELPDHRWLRRAVNAIQESGASGAYTHLVTAPSSPLFSRYFDRLHADPFNWFVYGDAANPRRFDRVYPVLAKGDDWVIFDLTVGPRPLVALAQGYIARGVIPLRPECWGDDISPVWDIIDRGERLVYIDIGIHHHHVHSLASLVRKYRRRTQASLCSTGAGFRTRRRQSSSAMRRREIMWLPYSLSVVGPTVDALRRYREEPDAAWAYHPIACVALTVAMALGVLDALRSVARRSLACTPRHSVR